VKRYLRRGSNQLSMIYPGTLEGLTDALRDAQKASEKHQGFHEVGTHEPGSRARMLYRFADGECVLAPAPVESEDMV
jgi:hypothetical protein